MVIRREHSVRVHGAHKLVLGMEEEMRVLQGSEKEQPEKQEKSRISVSVLRGEC